MMIEVQRFVEWTADVGNDREHMRLEPMLIEPKYISWVRRNKVGNVDMCMVCFGTGAAHTLDKTFEEMREIMRGSR